MPVNKYILIGLLHNTAILLALSITYEFWWVEESYRKKLNKALTGIIIGVTGIILMLTPWTMVPGIMFDTRSVLLSVSGLFFGPIPTAVAMMITAVFRIIQGGAGVWMGLAVIISSGLTGILWNKFRPKWKEHHHAIELLALGYTVHALMLLCTFLLPGDLIKPTFEAIIIPLLTIYPAGTLLLGALLLTQYKNWQNRLAMKKLAESERRFSEMLKNMNLYSLITDPDGLLIFCNQAFLDATGYTLNELEGKNLLTILVPPDSVEKTRQALNRVKNNQARGFTYETEILTKKGIPVVVSWNYTTLRDEETGKLTGIACIGENITTRKKAEAEIINAKLKAEENDRLKSEFLANMSHEIRTPLNAIVGFSELLIRPGTSEEEKKQFRNIITNSSNRLLQLINDIIEFSKLEAGQLTVSLSECNVYELINNSVESMRVSPEFRNKNGINLLINLPEELCNLNIVTDPKRVQQVLDNLLSNAIKYTDRGFIEAGARIINKNNTDYIEFYVKDTGAGIQEDKKDLIFERFRKLEEGRFKEGAGLGLSISKGIAELLKGEIRVDSVYGKGSTFYFSIPYERSRHTGSPGCGKSSEVPELQNRKIIIADDDQHSLLYIDLIIKDSGATIYHAENGKILLDLLKDVDPDLILLDLRMPVMDGFEVMLKLKENKSHAKVIAQTAYAMAGEKERCLALGCHGYIAKPFNVSELLNTIKEVLSKN